MTAVRREAPPASARFTTSTARRRSRVKTRNREVTTVNVKLLRRWGSHPAGESVQVDDEQARWLVQHAYGTAKGITAAPQNAAAPGTDGPDPSAGGDWSRQGRPVAIKGARRDNNALPVDGAPRQYNAGVRAEEPPKSARPRKRS